MSEHVAIQPQVVMYARIGCDQYMNWGALVDLCQDMHGECLTCTVVFPSVHHNVRNAPFCEQCIQWCFHVTRSTRLAAHVPKYWPTYCPEQMICNLQFPGNVELELVKKLGETEEARTALSKSEAPAGRQRQYQYLRSPHRSCRSQLHQEPQDD